MSGALKSRFIHLDKETDLEDVCRVALNRDWSPVVIAFLRFRPDLLHSFPSERPGCLPIPGRGSSSPIWLQHMIMGIGRCVLALTSGTIGAGAGIESSRSSSICGVNFRQSMLYYSIRPGRRFRKNRVYSLRYRRRSHGGRRRIRSTT